MQISWPSPGPTVPFSPPGPARWNVIVAIILAVVVMMVTFGLFASALSGFASDPFGGFVFSPFLFAPFCGIFIFILIMVVVAVLSQGANVRRLPPPPPIQQPMVPARAPGLAELACPNCGAAPTNVDRFGVATCGYCNTRFLVR